MPWTIHCGFCRKKSSLYSTKNRSPNIESLRFYIYVASQQKSANTWCILFNHRVIIWSYLLIAEILHLLVSIKHFSFHGMKYPSTGPGFHLSTAWNALAPSITYHVFSISFGTSLHQCGGWACYFKQMLAQMGIFPNFRAWKRCLKKQALVVTPPKINIEPENDGLEDVFPFPGVYSQVPCSSSWVLAFKWFDDSMIESLHGSIIHPPTIHGTLDLQ